MGFERGGKGRGSEMRVWTRRSRAFEDGREEFVREWRREGNRDGRGWDGGRRMERDDRRGERRGRGGGGIGMFRLPGDGLE